MPDTELATALAQCGAAGLIGWMWLSERRAAATREAQLRELHERLIQERPQLAALLSVIRDNTRALTALESGQRTLAAALDRLRKRSNTAPRADNSSQHQTHPIDAPAHCRPFRTRPKA